MSNFQAATGLQASTIHAMSNFHEMLDQQKTASYGQTPDKLVNCFKLFRGFTCVACIFPVLVPKIRLCHL